MVYSHKCIESKNSYLTNKFNNCNGDQRKIYSLIDEVTYGKINPGSLFPDGDNLPFEFGKFFGEKVDRINNSIKETLEKDNISSPFNNDILSMQAGQFNSFSPLSEVDVHSLITSSKSKSSIIDPIPTKLLKSCLDVLISPIKHIVNKSLISGSLPQNWKNAIVSPLLKKSGLDLELSNYRPVSNLPFYQRLSKKQPFHKFNRT